VVPGPARSRVLATTVLVLVVALIPSCASPRAPVVARPSTTATPVDGGAGSSAPGHEAEPVDPATAPTDGRCPLLDRYAARTSTAAAAVGDREADDRLRVALARDAADTVWPEPIRADVAVWAAALVELGRVRDDDPAGADPKLRSARVRAVLERPEVVAAVDRIEAELRRRCDIGP
jgi:hypothetical protein